MAVMDVKGRCHCRQLEWHFVGELNQALVCNCTYCRRMGALWAYGFLGEEVTVRGLYSVYERQDLESAHLAFHSCPTCGALGYWQSLSLNGAGKRRIAVNLRLAEAAVVAHLCLKKFDGLDTFSVLSAQTLRVGDVWP